MHAVVANHIVQGRIIFPGAGYLEMARAAAKAPLRGVHFLQPLGVEVQGVLVECAVVDGRFEIRSSQDEDFADATIHCSGTLGANGEWTRVVPASMRVCSHAAHVGALYEGFAAVGLQYGPRYRTLSQAWGSTSGAMARLRARSTQEGTAVHPADLDDALCASALIASSGKGGSETRLPFAVDDAHLQGASGELWAVRVSGCTPAHLRLARR